MEKINRELLIKEISARLPYGVKVNVWGWDEGKGAVEVPLKVYSINTDDYLSFEYNHYCVETVNVEDCRLYLRPMSSMTQEECRELRGILITEPFWCMFDFFYSHHIDFRDLIPKGLALEAYEDMYKIKEK